MLRRLSLVALPAAAVLAIFYVAYRLVDPLPPRRLVMGAGIAGSGYDNFARRYARILARDCIDLEIRNTAGAVENLSPRREGQHSWNVSLDSSFLGGGTLGCNWQPLGTAFVLGIEGEGGYLKLQGSAFDPLISAVLPVAAVRGTPDVLGSAKIGNGYGMITGRLGYAWAPALIYVKGGAAFVSVQASILDQCNTVPAGCGNWLIATSGSQIRTTGTVGGGLEWALPYQWRNWSIKAEYMFIGLGHDTLTACGTAITPAGTPVGGGQFCFNHDFSGIHTAKIGLNYRFVLILEFGFLSAARGRQRTHRCYADAVVALSKAFALSTASDAACAISSDFDSFVGSFMLLAWPCASLHSAEPIRTILTGSLARAKSNAPVALKLRRIRTSLFQSKRKSRLLTAGHSQRAWPFSDCLRVNYSRQAHRPLQMTVGLHCTSEVCNGSFSSDRPAPNAVGMSLCADRVRTFAPQRFDAVCQQRNFRGHRFTLPPFAGNPNGVVVYPPYLMGQYCGMLFRIWWH